MPEGGEARSEDEAEGRKQEGQKSGGTTERRAGGQHGYQIRAALSPLGIRWQ
jgi:hypothetical protein